jgi:protein-disulfide isomerase
MGITRTLAFVAATMVPFGAQAFDINAMNDEQREVFRQEVRAYLLDNPSVLVEAMNVLEKQQQQAETKADEFMLEQNAEELFNDGVSHVSGNPDGDIVIVEFMDYRCGYCRKAKPEVAELVKSDGNIKLITKEYPILGDASTASAKLAIATLQALGGEAYEKMHTALMVFNGPINPKSIRMLSKRNGLDAEKIIAQMDSAEVEEHIDRMHNLGRAMQVSGTPTFVVGGAILRGYVPLKGMRQIVAAERELAN